MTTLADDPSTTPDSARTEKDKLFEDALRQARNGDVEGARAMLEQARQLDPTDRTIVEMLRVMRRRSNRPPPNGQRTPAQSVEASSPPAEHDAPSSVPAPEQREAPPHADDAPAEPTDAQAPEPTARAGAPQQEDTSESNDENGAPQGESGPSEEAAPSAASRLSRRIAGLLARTVAGPKQALASLRMRRTTARQPLPRVHVERSVPYLYDKIRAHHLNIYRSDAMPRVAPALLFFEAGGFPGRLGAGKKLAASFARRGFLAVHVRYRTLPAYPFPAALVDCARAYRWFLERASALGADADRVVVGGDTLSANLALALSLACCHPREERWAWELFELGPPPSALLSIAGYLQASQPERLVHDAASPRAARAIASFSKRYLNVDPRLSPHACALADPLLVLEQAGELARPLPKCFAVVGTDDIVTPDTQRLEHAYHRHGGVCRVHYVEGKVLGRVGTWNPSVHPWVEQMHDFVEETAPEA